MATTKVKTTATKKPAPAAVDTTAAEIKKLTAAVAALTKQVESLKKDVSECQHMCKSPAAASSGKDMQVRAALRSMVENNYPMKKALSRAGI